MISLQEAVEIHSILIEQFGGGTGIRDTELLKSALHRPFQTFDNKDLYKSPIDKAALLLKV